MTLGQHGNGAIELVRRLIGRIDEDDAAPLGRRQLRLGDERGIEAGDSHPGIAAIFGSEARMVLGMELVERQAVLRPQAKAGDLGGARIAAKRCALPIDRGDRGAPGCQHRLGRRRQKPRRAVLVIEPADAVAPFAGAGGGIACEIIDSDAGMGVEDAKRRLFALEALDHGGEDDMLQHIGMAAGVEGMAVVHGPSLADCAERHRGAPWSLVSPIG